MSSVPLRIVQIVGHVAAGGVEGIVMNYYRHMDHSKIQFDFIMDGYNKTTIDDEIRASGGRVYKVAPYAKNLLKNQQQIYQILSRNSYPIVHSHMNALSVFYLIQAKRAGIPIRIAHSHSTAAKGEGVKTAVKYLLIPYAKNFPTHYAACSEFSGKWLFGKEFYESGKVNLIKNAIDINLFSYNPEIRQLKRTAMGLNDKFVIGHVGRFEYQKNHTFLIDIFDQIKKVHADSVLLLAGSGNLDPSIKAKVKKLKLTDSVRFLGVRQDIPDLMQAMDVFVLPSFYEGLPIVGIEAQASGLPCILSDAVTQETKIVDSVKFLSLSAPATEWAEVILSYVQNDRRAKTDDQIRNAGYDINLSAAELAGWYRQLAGADMPVADKLYAKP